MAGISAPSDSSGGAPTVNWWTALLGFLTALPKLVNAIESIGNKIDAGNYQNWRDALDEATRIGVEAGKKGHTLDQAVEQSRKWGEVFAGIRKPPSS